ncbi:hypothetical protein [Paenibacillus naphthalenovorans]|uniref:hypothetical protein n=1 Tax=Paenibacillus naphthalenovorans TaxID=162209 RepID=UPI000891BD2C|nr:hypothetical protein [Paenibacillus naphthalenovorans]SDJ86965.1 hypothetical protein SAMN05421868_15115 [Paenibacillus naphthalenovorans]
MRKFFLSLLLSCLVISLVSLSSALAKETIPPEVQNAAKEGMKAFKELVSKDPVAYGYKNADEVAQTTLGEGHEVYYIDGNKAIAAPDSSNLSSLAVSANQWEYIVYLNKEARSFLTIGFEDNQYKVVQFGGDSKDFKIAKSNFETLTKEKGDIIPKIIKSGNVRYLTAVIGGQELALPDVPKGKEMLAGNKDNSRLWLTSDIVKFIKTTKQNYDKHTGEKPTSGYIAVENSNKSTNKYVMLSLAALISIFLALMFYKRKKA